MDAPFSLPTPRTLEQRLDAAAEAYRTWTMGRQAPEMPWGGLLPVAKLYYSDAAEVVCRAFAPEHFKEGNHE